LNDVDNDTTFRDVQLPVSGGEPDGSASPGGGTPLPSPSKGTPGGASTSGGTPLRSGPGSSSTLIFFFCICISCDIHETSPNFLDFCFN
jgi:hypothetical protein